MLLSEVMFRWLESGLFQTGLGSGIYTRLLLSLCLQFRTSLGFAMATSMDRDLLLAGLKLRHD